MSKTRRERVALLIFFALVFAGAFILIGYFSTGRSWSVAATAVDDRVGQMEGYTAIVYSGVAEKESRVMLPATEPIQASQTEDASSQTPVQQKDTNLQTDKETGLGLRLLMLAAEVGSVQDGQLYVSDVRNLYEKRGADVLSLDLANNAAAYQEPQIFKVGNKKIGVFAIKERLSRTSIANITTSLRKRGAVTVVCIAPRPALISTYEGIDVSLITQATHQYSLANSPTDNTVVANSPEIGNVGVILFTSNNIPSTKTVESL